MRLRLPAKPSTAERRQTLCAVQTLSGFPQRSFPAHKRAILRTSHTKLPFFDKQSRARMRWARLKFRLCRGDAVHAYACRSPTQRAAVHHTALPWARLWGTSRMRWFSLPRNRRSRLRCAKTNSPSTRMSSVAQQLLSGPAFRFPEVVQRYSLYSWQPRNHWPSAAFCQFSKSAPAWLNGSPPENVTPRHQRVCLHHARTGPPQTYPCPRQTPSSRGCGSPSHRRAAPLREDGSAQARAVHNGIAP